MILMTSTVRALLKAGASAPLVHGEACGAPLPQMPPALPRSTRTAFPAGPHPRVGNPVARPRPVEGGSARRSWSSPV